MNTLSTGYYKYLNYCNLFGAMKGVEFLKRHSWEVRVMDENFTHE